MKKSAIQHLIAIGIFLVITLFYCYPALQGNKLVAGDTIHWMGMSQEARTWYEKTGENPMWSNSMFGGMPTVTHYMRGKTNWIYPIQEFFTETLPSPTFFFLIAMVCFYILMLSWNANRWVSIIGAIAFAFASYNLQIITAGHNTKMFSIGYMPLVLAGMHWVYQKKYLAGAGAALVGLSLMISNAMYQIDYYLFIILIGFGIGYFMQALKEGNVKQFFISSAIMVAVGLVAVGPSLDLLMFTKEYTSQTMRGGQSEVTLGKKEKKSDGGLDKDYAFAWSQSIGETFTLFVPNLYGGGGQVDVGTGSNYYEALTSIGASEDQATEMSKNASTYWGPQPFLSGPMYFGIVIMLLMVLGLFVIKNNLKWVIFSIGVFGIMLSWGKHFSALNYFLFDHLPMYNKFRTPNMAMTIPAFMFCLLGIWALNELFSDKITKEKLWDSLKKSLIIVGGIVLFFGIGGRMFLSYKGANDDKLKSQFVQMMGGEQNPQSVTAATKIYNAIVDDRPSIAMKDSLRSLLFLLLAAGILWLYIKNKLEMQKAILALGIVIAIDLISMGMRYLNADNYRSADEYDAQFVPRPVDNQILQDKDPYYRVYDLSTDPYNDAMGAYHHKLVGGYHPAKMETFQDLIDNQLQPGSKLNGEVLNMLNTKYIIFNAQGGKPAAQPNPNACGNAWFVNTVQLVDNADAEILALNAENIGDTAKMANPFRAKETAIVQKKHWKTGTTNFEKDSSRQIALAKYGLNNLTFASSSSKDGFAVFSDIYYPLGWKAFIDGKEANIVKTNYVLRGLAIPAGNHKIEFVFKPETYFKWGKVSLISSILILLVLLGGLGLGIKNGLKQQEA
nr:YfhO family protein [Chitinophagaceae bacterium]